MGTEILRPQDCLIERMRFNHHHQHQGVIPRRKSNYAGNTNPKSYRKTVIRPEPKKRVSQVTQVAEVSEADRLKSDLVMGKVTILKRGESVDLGRKNENFMKKTEELVPIRVMDRKSEEVYAGSAFFMSPSPRALPLPTFSKKKEEDLMIVDYSATKDLRRMLGIDC